MQSSSTVFDLVAGHLIGRLAPANALDIGAGDGKFGRLLRTAAPACDRSALELEPELVAQHGLAELYWRVETVDAARWWRDNPDEIFDLVVLGDCLQQMPKSEGLDLLNAMTYRSAWMLVLVPEFIVQGAIDGRASAVHRSVWSERDFGWHDLWAWDHERGTTLVLLRGYLPSPVDIDSVLDGLERADVALRETDGTLVRPCRLRLVDHRRELPRRPR